MDADPLIDLGDQSSVEMPLAVAGLVTIRQQLAGVTRIVSERQVAQRRSLMIYLGGCGARRKAQLLSRRD